MLFWWTKASSPRSIHQAPSKGRRPTLTIEARSLASFACQAIFNSAALSEQMARRDGVEPPTPRLLCSTAAKNPQRPIFPMCYHSHRGQRASPAAESGAGRRPRPADRRVLQWFKRFMPQGKGLPTAREGNIAEVFRASAVERHIVDLSPSMLHRSVQDIDRVHPLLEDRVFDQAVAGTAGNSDAPRQLNTRIFTASCVR